MSIKRNLIILTLSLFSMFTYGLNKCVDHNGNVAYQDKPCPGDVTSQSIKVKANRDSGDMENLRPVRVSIPDLGDAVFFSYKWWNVRIIQPSADLPPTVKMTSKKGEVPLSFSLTFIPNKIGKKISETESADNVYAMASRYVPGSVEQKVQLGKLDTTIGTAIYASFNEKKYLHTKPPTGEYSSITVGQAAHSKLIVGFTVLTNGTHSKALEEALNIIASFKIVASTT